VQESGGVASAVNGYLDGEAPLPIINPAHKKQLGETLKDRFAVRPYTDEDRRRLLDIFREMKEAEQATHRLMFNRERLSDSSLPSQAHQRGS